MDENEKRLREFELAQGFPSHLHAKVEAQENGFNLTFEGLSPEWIKNLREVMAREC